jgi:hypothetical protein
MSAPEQKLADTLEFFERTISGQIHLTAIDPEKRRPTIGQDFGTDVSAAVKWAAEQNAAGMNVYFAVNRIRDGLHDRAKKEDVTAIRFAHVDIDPPKGRASFTEEEREHAYSRLLAAKPSTINWSGNGWQGLWRLGEGASEDEVEQINKGLIKHLGGDKGTHDASRLLRVPGLVNYPDAKKRQQGRVPRLSGITVEDDGAVHDHRQMLADFPPPAQAPKTPDRQSFDLLDLSDRPLLTADDLSLPEDALLRRLINEPDCADRSADTFRLACQALREGLTPDQVLGLLLNPANAISAHCFDQKDPQRAAKRAIESALSEPDVRAFARAHAQERERRLASGEADEALSAETKLWTLEAMLRECVFIEDGSQVADTTRLGYIRNLSEFRTASAASVLFREVAGKNGSARKVKSSVVEVWLAHPDRQSVSTRTFRAGAGPITTAPDGQSALNSWRGFRTLEAPDDWADRALPFIVHVEYLFGTDTDRFLDWVAHIAQMPGELPSTAWLHIAKKTGTGRNWLATLLGRVFRGYTALAYPLGLNLQNGFNGALAGKVLAIVDEINEGNSNRKHQVKEELKQLVTETERLINPKCARQFVEHNACRWLIFSNSPAALPLDDEDRRFNVVQFEGEPRDANHYSHLYRLLDERAFIGSVMQFLRNRDLSNFNPGERAPMTAAKAALLDRTRSDDEEVLRDLVERWPVDIITSEELHERLGENRVKGTVLRYALERAGIVKVGKWSVVVHFGRKEVSAYALRNTSHWAIAPTPKQKAEVARMSASAKECALYGEAEAGF